MNDAPALRHQRRHVLWTLYFLLMIGTTIGHFLVLEKLDEETYSGEDTRTAEAVVIRVIRLDGSVPAQRLRHAARTGSQLRQPGLCAPCHFVESGDALIVMTPRTAAVTLTERMASTPLSLAEVLHIGAQIGEALAAAHAAGLVHGYLSPDNILLEHGDQGPVAKLAHVGLEVRLNPHCAPECVAGQELTPRSDVWSLGSVLAAMIDSLPEPVKSALPAAADQVLSMALATDPGMRFHGAGEIAALLEGLRAASEFQPTEVMDASPETVATTITEGPSIPIQSILGIDNESRDTVLSESRYVDLGLLGRGAEGAGPRA
jgi:serine/threonine protein kinase